jgi:hypothetical protein
VSRLIVTFPVLLTRNWHSPLALCSRYDIAVQDVGGIPSAAECEDITETVRSQIKDMMDRIGQGDEHDRSVQQAQEEKVGCRGWTHHTTAPTDKFGDE